MVKNPPARTGDTGSVPGLKDPLEKEMATHSSVLAWKIPWTDEPGRLQSMESQRVRYDLMSKQQQKILSLVQGWNVLGCTALPPEWRLSHKAERRRGLPSRAVS